MVPSKMGFGASSACLVLEGWKTLAALGLWSHGVEALVCGGAA